MVPSSPWRTGHNTRRWFGPIVRGVPGFADAETTGEACLAPAIPSNVHPAVRDVNSGVGAGSHAPAIVRCTPTAAAVTLNRDISVPQSDHSSTRVMPTTTLPGRAGMGARPYGRPQPHGCLDTHYPPTEGSSCSDRLPEPRVVNPHRNACMPPFPEDCGPAGQGAD